MSSARRKAALAPLLAAPPEEDQTSWLVTFSDLVLQLFAFVLVALVLGQARASSAPPVSTRIRQPAVADAPTEATASAERHPGRADPATAPLAAPERTIDARLPEAGAGRFERAPETRIGDESRVTPPRLGDRELESADAAPSSDAEDSAVAPGAAPPRDSELAAVAAAAASTPGWHVAEEPSVAPVPSGVAESDDQSAHALAAEVTGLGSYLDAFVAAAGLGDGVTVATDGAGVRVGLHGGVGFSSGSAELGPAAAPLLRELRKLAQTLPDVQVQVAGYTDDVPIRGGRFASNLELSLARAARVARELGAGEPDASLTTVAMGFGAQDAIASNTDAHGRARNRRVEVRLLPRAHSMP